MFVIGSQSIETADMKKLKEEKELKKKGGDRDNKEVSGKTGPPGGKEVCTHTMFRDSSVN